MQLSDFQIYQIIIVTNINMSNIKNLTATKSSDTV